LLNKVPDTVALFEPMEVHRMVGLDPSDIVREIDRFFSSCRTSLLTEGWAPSKVNDGAVPDNPYSDTRAESGLRPRMVNDGRLEVHGPLTDTFRLGLKHPAAFTALLPLLVQHWPCFAIVRNPLSTLLSWDSLTTLNVHHGRIPMAEAFAPELRAGLDARERPLDRQLFLLDWSWTRYLTLLAPEHIIRYEEMVASGGQALSVIEPQAAALREPLFSKNTNPVYDPKRVEALATAILGHGGAWSAYYPREATEMVVEAMRGRFP
jgi:hypothetical protein